MKYIDEIMKDLPINITAVIGNLKQNYRYGTPQITHREVEHEIAGYLGGLYDCGVITAQEREALYEYCIGKYDD